MGILYYIQKFFSREKKRPASRYNESLAQTSDIEIPCPKGLAYAPYQKAAVEYAINRQRVLIADDVGLGKTIEALGVANFLESESILVICTATAKINWAREAQKWLVRGLPIYVLKKGKPFPLSGTCVVIINYDILGYFLTLRDRLWDLVILDEAHYCKTEEAHRTVRTMKIADKGERLIEMTGSPVINRPNELITLLKMLHHPIIANEHQFVRNYCEYQSPFGWVKPKPEKLVELQNILRSTMMIRRMKREVMKDLPAKRRKVVELEILSEKDRVLFQQEKEAVDHYRDAITQMKEEAGGKLANGDRNGYKEVMRGLKAFKQERGTHVFELRHKAAKAKIPYIISYLENVVQNEQKVVVFAHHRAVIKAIYQRFESVSVKCTGDEKGSKKQEAIDRFHDDPSILFFLGSIRASGQSINLQNASYCIFAELDWSPEIMEQAEGRIDRWGQENPMLIEYLIVEGSFDAFLTRLCVEKEGVINKVVNA